jgi:hypothetical protein
VAQGLRRLGFDGKARVYFELNATLDIRRSEACNREVLAPLGAENPAVAVAIGERAFSPPPGFVVSKVRILV